MSSREQTGAPIPWNEFRPTVGSTIAVILGVALLLGLGSWQMVRLDWKTGLIAERTAQLEAQPILLPTDAGDLLDVMWSPVKLTGRFLHDQEIFLSARSQRGNIGSHVLTPFVRDAGPTVLVNRGWVPEERRDPARRAAAQVEGTVRVVGLVTPGAGRNSFTPDNDPTTSFWLSVDYAAMAAVVGRDLQPVVIDADATPNEGGFPLGAQTRLDIPNDHLQYAITWYLLALTLVAVYIGWNRKTMREQQSDLD